MIKNSFFIWKFSFIDKIIIIFWYFFGKTRQKKYFSHSGFPGGDKEILYSRLKEKNPEKIIHNAVKGMLPHNKLGRKLLKHLKVYAGSNHPHDSQQPKPYTV